MCYNGTFRFKKLDDSFWNGETFRFADYMLHMGTKHRVTGHFIAYGTPPNYGHTIYNTR